ncbi:MAG TPA: sulfatase [Ktedonobacteraceae bacterium]|nr:sulfatase [Ktedonobacteraceae bacterium]
MRARPDIVLLVLDTQRVDRLSCYGNQLETSPYIDELAADSTFFRHAVSTAQWTVPSHASMFTGLYPSSHTMFHSSSVLPESMTTLAERLRDHHYFTAAYCNNPLLGVVNNGLRRGFNSFLNYSGWMTSRPNQIGGRQHLFDRYRKHFKRFLANALTGIQDVFARSDTLLDFSFSPLMVPLWQTALSFKGNTARALNDAAQLLVKREGIPEDQPIFSFINLMGTHMPYHPPRRFVERFAPHVLEDKSAQHYLRRFNSDVFGWLAPLASAMDAKEKATLDGMYNAEVANQDEQVGAFLEKLRASGRLDRTFFIVCADHGEHLGEKELMGHSISLYNELVHVPLFIRDPSGDLPRSTTIESTISTRRLFHTILTTAGIATEAEQRLTLAQKNVDADLIDSIVYSEGVTPQNALILLERRRPELVRKAHLKTPRRTVWSERYKLIQTGEDQVELYDFFDDPGETLNLRDILPEQVEAMQERLQSFMQHVDVGTPNTENDPYNDPQVYHRLRNLGYLE